MNRSIRPAGVVFGLACLWVGLDLAHTDGRLGGAPLGPWTLVVIGLAGLLAVWWRSRHPVPAAPVPPIAAPPAPPAPPDPLVLEALEELDRLDPVEFRPEHLRR